MNEKLGESGGFDVESKTFLPSIFNAPLRNRHGIGTVTIEINLSGSGCSFRQSVSERQAGSQHCHRLAGSAARVPSRPGSARHDRWRWTISILGHRSWPLPADSDDSRILLAR